MFARIRGLMQYSFDLPAQILFYFVNKILLRRNNCYLKLTLPLFPDRVTRLAHVDFHIDSFLAARPVSRSSQVCTGGLSEVMHFPQGILVGR